MCASGVVVWYDPRSGPERAGDAATMLYCVDWNIFYILSSKHVVYFMSIVKRVGTMTYIFIHTGHAWRVWHSHKAMSLFDVR